VEDRAGGLDALFTHVPPRLEDLFALPTRDAKWQVSSTGVRFLGARVAIRGSRANEPSLPYLHPYHGIPGVNEVGMEVLILHLRVGVRFLWFGGEGSGG
jgi:hypothetical protein